VVATMVAMAAASELVGVSTKKLIAIESAEIPHAATGRHFARTHPDRHR
jgi:hypothetical protein